MIGLADLFNKISKSKIKVIIVLLIFILIFILICTGRNINKDEELLHLDDGIFIYSDFYNNISAFVEEDVLIQIPIYDFGNTLDNKVVDIDINGLKECTAKDISLENKQVFDEFDSYTLTFYISFDDAGTYSFDDATVSIVTDCYNIEKSIGRYDVSIYERNNNSDIEITGGTAMEEVDLTSDVNSGEYVKYPVEYRIKNNTNNNININSISINSNDNIKIDMKPDIIESNEEKKIMFDILLKDGIVNSIIKPVIEYSIDNKNNIILPATPIIIADPVPVDRLYEIIDK